MNGKNINLMLKAYDAQENLIFDRLVKIDPRELNMEKNDLIVKFATYKLIK